MAGAENGESGKNTVLDAKEDVKQKIKEAKQSGGQQLSGLVASLLAEIEVAKTPAEEVISITQKTQGLIPGEIRYEAKQVTTAVVKVLEGVKEGIINTVPAKSQVVLSKLADQSLSDGTACYLYKIVEKYLVKEMTFSKKDEAETEFERDFKGLINQNPIAADLLKEALKAVAQEINLTEDDINKKFNVTKREQTTGNEVTKEEREEYFDIGKKLRIKLNEDMQKEKDKRKLSLEEPSILKRFINGSMNEDMKVIGEIFKKLGLNPAEAVKYSKFEDTFFNRQNPEELMMFITDSKLKGSLRAASEDFTKDGLIKLKILILKADGSFELDRHKFIKQINEYYYHDSLENVFSQHSQLWEQVYGQNQQYIYFFNGLGGLIRKVSSELSGLYYTDHKGEPLKDTEKFLKDKSGRYLGTILSLAETFHNLPLYARDVTTFEKWGSFLGYLFPTELSEVFDPDDPIMEVARRATSEHLRERVAINDNQVPHDLYSGQYSKESVIYSSEDRDTIKENIRTKMKEVYKELYGEKKEPEEWELERAITYAAGIGISNLIDPEVIGTADVSPGADFKGIYPLLPALFAKFNWGGLGRGRDKAGYFQHLLYMDVKLYPSERGFVPRLFKKRPWVPEIFNRFVAKQNQVLANEVMQGLVDCDEKKGKGDKKRQRNWLNTDASYQELLSMVNIASSLIGRGGWRIKPMKEAMLKAMKKMVDEKGNFIYKKEIEGKKDEKGEPEYENLFTEDIKAGAPGWTDKDWENYMTVGTKMYGVSALWWIADERANAEIKKFIIIEKFNEMKKERKNSGKNQEEFEKELWTEAYNKMDEEWAELAERSGIPAHGERSLERIFKINIDHEEHMLNYSEFFALKQSQIRGEIFYRYLHRNPGDFLMLMTQLCPQIINTDINYFQTEEQLKANLPSGDKMKSAKEQESILMYRRSLETRWGIEQFNKLGEIREWLIKLASDGTSNGERDKDGKIVINDYFKKLGCSDFKKFVTYFVDQSGIAFEKLLKDQGLDEKGNPIDKELSPRKPWIRDKYFSDEVITKALFDKQYSLFSIIGTEMNNPNFEHSGGFDDKKIYHTGKAGLFFKIGQIWTIKQGDINPFSTDMNHFEIYKQLGEVGEDTIKRVLGDAETIRKNFEGLGKLDQMLLEAARNKDMSEIYKLHKGIYDSLKNVISKDYAQRASYIMATVVAKFFFEHQAARSSIPVVGTVWNLFSRLFIGKNLSLSRILSEDPLAMTLDANGVRTYFQRLWQMDCIPRKGIWSVDQLDKAFDAQSDTFMVGEAGPNLLWLLLLFMLFSSIRGGIKELEPKKQ